MLCRDTDYKVIKYFTTFYGYNLTISMILEFPQLDEFCEFNKIKKENVLNYIDIYVTKKDSSNSGK